MNYKVYTVRVYENGDIYWYNEREEFHNEYGPAVEWGDGSKEYWLNDIWYKYYGDWKTEVEKLNKPEVKELTVSEVSKLLGYDVKIVKE